MASDNMSVLINDLTSVPKIIGSLGLGIAAAQKAFNLDYLNSIQVLIKLAKDLRGKKDDDSYKEILNDIIKAMAPARYQFTETTFTVRMDLAQSLQKATSAGLGVSMGAVTINAAMTKGFAYDYRASAEVKTVIHAIDFDATTMNTLLERAKDINEHELSLPEDASVDKEIIDKSAEIYKQLSNSGTTGDTGKDSSAKTTAETAAKTATKTTKNKTGTK